MKQLYNEAHRAELLFPITARPEVFYSSGTAVICQFLIDQ